MTRDEAMWLAEVARLRAEVEKLERAYEDMLFARGAMADAPCFCCGYNGPGYYHPDTHPCAKRHHALERLGAAIDAAKEEAAWTTASESLSSS